MFLSTPTLFMKKLISLAAATLMTAAPLFAGDNTIVIKGSDTLGARLVPQLSEQFKAANPGVDFQIAAEGSATGIAALIDATAQIGMSSREVTATEISTGQLKGVVFKPTIVAYDGICVILNSANGVKNLTKKQVEKIFTGEITDWSAVGGAPGPISIYTRNTSSGTYKDFQGMAMSKRDYATSSQKMAGNEQIAEEVGKNAAGIGYVGMAYANSTGVKAVTVDDIEATADNVRSKKYPYSRATYYYTNGDPTGITKKFIDFTVSDEGQKIVEQVGFVPLK